MTYVFAAILFLALPGMPVAAAAEAGMSGQNLPANISPWGHAASTWGTSAAAPESSAAPTKHVAASWRGASAATAGATTALAPAWTTPYAAPRRGRDRRPTAQGDFASLCLPIKRAGNLLLVEAKIDSMVGNFILDFGAPYLVLNKTYFRQYATTNGGIAGDVTGQRAAILRTQVDRLEMETLFYDDVPADLADLGEIENQRGVKILGLLGLDLFTSLTVTLDPLQDVLTLQKPDGEGKAIDPDILDSRPPELTLPMRVEDNTILLDGKIAGKKVLFMLDTGAEVNVLDNDNPSKILREMHIERRMALYGSAGGQVEVLAGELSEIDLGGRIFPGGKTIITDLDAMGKNVGYGIQAMLGHAFLDQGIVRLNFVRNELYWYPFVAAQIDSGSEALQISTAP